MDYFRGLKAVFADTDWVGKFGVAACLVLTSMCIPLIGQIVVLGWGVEVTKRDLRGEPGLPPLRFSTEELMRYLEPGFRFWIVRLVYAMPLMGLLFPLFFCVQVGMVTSMQAHRDVGAAAGIGPLFIVGLMPVFFMGMLATHMLATYAEMRVAVSGKLSTAFDFGEVIAGVRRIGVEMLIGMLALGIAGFCLQLIGMLACFVGMFFTMNIAVAANALFLADLIRLDGSRGGPLKFATQLEEVVETLR